MSGTSLDGLDLAYCHFWKQFNRWEFKIVQTKSIPYEMSFQTRLQEAIALPAEHLLRFHNEYGTWLGEQVHLFRSEENLNVDFIASHGHTIHHQPQQGFTFQLGSGQHLANACGIKTICDFRMNDIALGGQGAPLVPIGDQMLFGAYDFCLNLGGISNISFQQDGKRIAYDIGIANMLLNHITKQHGLAYDKGGALARKGTLIPELLGQLNALDYYSQPFPKSTGYEWFSTGIVPIITAHKAPMESLLYTAIQHICEQIAIPIKAVRGKKEKTILVTGGGACNSYMMEVLQTKLGKNNRLHIPDQELIEFKEALIFALMGVLRLEQEINVLHSVTGARKDSSSGVLFLPS